jgi:hypothetical protein
MHGFAVVVSSWEMLVLRSGHDWEADGQLAPRIAATAAAMTLKEIPRWEYRLAVGLIA